MQNALESLKYGGYALRRQISQHLAALHHEVTSQLHRVFRGLLKQQEKQLQSDYVTQHLLVDQMGNHSSGRHANDFIVALVCSLKLQDHPSNDQIDDLRQFGVYDGNQGSVDMSEIGRGHLSLYNGSSQNPLASKDVLVEQLHYHILNVRYVHLGINYLILNLPC